MSHSNQIIMNSRELGLSLQRKAIQILEKNQTTERLAIVGIHTCGAALVDRGERQLPIQPDYIGFNTTVRKDERIQVQLSEYGQEDRVIIER